MHSWYAEHMSKEEAINCWHMSLLVPDFILAIMHSMSLVLRHGTVCHLTFDLHQRSLFSKIASKLICFSVIFCSWMFINLIRVPFAVPRHCSDFMDMLRRLINWRIIIQWTGMISDYLQYTAAMKFDQIIYFIPQSTIVHAENWTTYVFKMTCYVLSGT